MSISTIQEKLFNKGCGSALIVAAALAMGASMFSSQCNGADDPNGPAGANGGGKPVAFVDGVPVTAQAIQADADASGGRTGPLNQAESLAYATNGAVYRAALQALVAKGPALTSAEVEKASVVLIDNKIKGAQMQLMGQGKLKFDASEADLEKALKDQLGGKTLKQIRASAVSDTKTAFAADATKPAVIAQLAPIVLAARLGETAVGNDQQLRDSYKSYVLKRVFFGPQSGAKEPPAVRAAKAEADLKAGTSFDKLMDTVSNDPPVAPGKPAHESTTSLPMAALEARPELASLKGKPVGTTTGVVDADGGKAIYRLDSMRDDAPPDFEAKKAELRAAKAQQAGQEALQKAVTDLVAKSVRWESKGFQALFAVADAQRDPLKKPMALELAQAAGKLENRDERRLGAMAMLIATSSPQGAPADAPKHPARLAALEAALAVGLDDATLALERADLYGAAKDGAKTTAALVGASKANLQYDAAGNGVFRDIATKARKFEEAKVITADQVKEIQAQQDAWRAARAQSEKSAAAAKTQSATGDKANEAEIARQKAEAAKAAGGATPPASPTDADKANAAEIARQKAEAAKGKGR